MKSNFRIAISRYLIPITLGSVLIGCDSHDHEKIVNEYQLAPRGQETISFRPEHKLRVTFSTLMPSEDRSRCENKCIRMFYVDKHGEGEAVTSPTNATIDITPKDDNIQLTVQNLEMFPIEVKVSRFNL